MALRKLTQINAVAVALALILAIPGPNAWGAVAGTVRPAAAAGGNFGAAGAVHAAFSVSPLTATSLTASLTPTPSLTASLQQGPAASALIAAPMAPAASALAASPASRALAAAEAPAAVAAAQAEAVPGLSAAQQIRALAIGDYQVVNEESADAAGPIAQRAVAMFDGMLARPRPLAVDGAESGDRLPNLQGSNARFPGEHVYISITLAEPGSPEALMLKVKELNEAHGFRLDIGGPAVQAPGVVVVRGAVPASQLTELSKAVGVIAVEPLVVRRFAPAKPLPETAFRSFYRNQATKNLNIAVLTSMPLHAFAVPMLVFPLFAGLVIAFPPALAFLKPVLLVGGGASLATFSMLQPLFRWIPASMRAALSFGALVVGGSLLTAFGSPMIGVWTAVNGLLGMVGAYRSFRRLAQTANLTMADKVVNAAEAALHANLLGGQLLILALSSFMSPWMLPLSLGVATALTLWGLTTKKEAPEPGLLPATPPGDQAPEPEQVGGEKVSLRTAKGPAKKAPAREPFVPASVKVTQLEKLLKTDRPAALKQATEYLIKETDKRPEVRISALRALETFSAAEAGPVYLEYLGSVAKPGIQLSKQTSMDKWWYFQWEILRRVAKDGKDFSPASAELLGVLKASYKDWNPSVRLMSAHALRALGQDPGPEVDPQPAPSNEPQQYQQGGAANGVFPNMPHRFAPQQPQGPNKKPGSNAWGWIVGLLLAGAIAFGIGSAMRPATVNPAAERPVATQTLAANGDMRVTGPQTAQAQAPAGNSRVQPADSTRGAATAQPQQTPSQAAAAYIAEQLAQGKAPQEITLQELERIAAAAERSAAAQEAANAAAAQRSGGSIFGTLLSFAFPILMIFFLFKMMRGGMGGGGGIGNVASAKTNTEKPKVRFHDVAGIDESMIEVEEIVDYLRNPGKYTKLGARVPKGVLLEGPPGTGKTLLAKALAGETDANFLSMSGSDFVQMYVGVGAARVRDLFAQAMAQRPAVIFIDEIDAVGKARSNSGISGGNDEKDQTINALLAAMDGFTDSTGIIVVAATNRAELLDAALTRPGRFDRKIHVGLPELIGREAILALHARKVRLGPDADLKYIARRSSGLSGAFLENVVIEAARLAARRGADEVSMKDLDEGVDRATIGAKRSLKLDEKLKRRIARHESGHVLANLLNEDPALRRPTNKVTIVPHGSGALGFAEIGDENGDTYLYTRRELEARIDHAMGGLVAEKIFYGEWSTGPGSDLQYATRIARTMVAQLGMDEKLGFPQTDADRNDPFGRSPFGDAVAAQVHEATKRIIQESYERVLKRLTANKHRLEAMSDALMDKETLIDAEINDYAFGDVPEKPADGETKK